MPYDPDKPPPAPDPPLDYDKVDAMGTVTDCYKLAADVIDRTLAAAKEAGVPPARLPEFIAAVGVAARAYDAGDKDGVITAMDDVRRVMA